MRRCCVGLVFFWVHYVPSFVPFVGVGGVGGFCVARFCGGFLFGYGAVEYSSVASARAAAVPEPLLHSSAGRGKQLSRQDPQQK